jgi:transposase
MMNARYTLAIDLAKRTHVACIHDKFNGETSKSIRVPVTKEGFENLLTILTSYSADPADFVVGCEATGHYGETLLRWLQSLGYPIIRLNPAQVVQFRRGLGRRAKTDGIDANSMALQLTVTDHMVESLPSETQQMLKRLTRLRLEFVTEQTRWVNRVRGLLDQIFPEVEMLLKKITTPTTLAILETYPSRQALANTSLSRLTKLIEKVSRKRKGREFAGQLKAAAQTSVGLTDPWLEAELQIIIRQLKSITTNINQLDPKIAGLTEQLLVERSAELGLEAPLTVDSFPCGSYNSLGTLLAEIGNINRYPSQKQLLSYLGWCPNTRESGESQSAHPKMSHQGNRFARRIIWLLAVSAIRFVPEYQSYYQKRIDAGKNKMKTLVAVGRKLLGVILAILRTGNAYDPSRYLEYQMVSESGGRIA